MNRLKNGKDTRQPLNGADLRALRALHRERQSDEWVFMHMARMTVGGGCRDEWHRK
jgi:hypothetical protein